MEILFVFGLLRVRRRNDYGRWPGPLLRRSKWWLGTRYRLRCECYNSCDTS